MNRSIPEATAARIRHMEAVFDLLQNVLAQNPFAIRQDAHLQEQLGILAQYYEGGLWLRDYELDELGLLPEDLKRGVLSQDALYDFFAQVDDVFAG